MSDLSEDRYGLVTGSKAHVLFPKRSNPKTQEGYALELAIAKYYRYSDEVQNWRLDHGHFGEAVAMMEFQNLYPEAYKPDFIFKDNYGGSADCIVEKEGFGVDFKCPTSLSKWVEYLTNGIDEQQYYQAQHYMALYKLDKWKVIAFLTETEFMANNGEVYPVDRKKRMIVIEVEKMPDYWEEMVVRSQPIIKRRDQIINQLIKGGI